MNNDLLIRPVTQKVAGEPRIILHGPRISVLGFVQNVFTPEKEIHCFLFNSPVIPAPGDYITDLLDDLTYRITDVIPRVDALELVIV